jgi:hypothetical protein
MGRLVLILPTLAACSTYAQHRAALVPHATPIPIDGQPMQAPRELTIGADNLVDITAPKVGDDTQGDVVPAQQLRGQLGFRLGRDASMSFIYQHAIAQNATVVSPTSPQITQATLAGAGAQLAYSIPTGTPGLRVGIAAELVIWHVPWVEFTECVENCSVPGYNYSNTGADDEPTLGFALVPSYKTGSLTLFGGVTIRNHPTVTQTTVTTLPDSDGDVQAGPFNATVHAGLGIDLGGGVTAKLLVHQTVTRDPVSYGPGVGLMLSIPLGHDEPPPPAYSPGYMPSPYAPSPTYPPGPMQPGPPMQPALPAPAPAPPV